MMTSELFEKGLQIRREVLGAEHVDASIANADDFSRPMQELVTEYCWGKLWGRPPFIAVLRRQSTAFGQPKKPFRKLSPGKSDDETVKTDRFYWFGQHGVSKVRRIGPNPFNRRRGFTMSGFLASVGWICYEVYISLATSIKL
jgi:hypothetical protein